jgi:hypothetical protein
MTPDGWIEIAFDVAVLMALYVPHGRYKACISEVRQRLSSAAEDQSEKHT